MVKKEFFKPIPFINRIKETEYINNYLTDIPSSILFIYGPKSTGKTTLIEKIIKELDQKKYALNYLDMRGQLIKDFGDFQKLFFPTSLKGKVKEIVSGIKVNIGFFGWDVNDEKLLYDNIFALMEEKLEKANEKGLKPVIILDEFQYLKNIIIEKDIRTGDKKDLELVEELFKFFIRITKVKHLAHVICLTSDSYYIEELYNHAKLKNTSKYYLINHLEKKDIDYWLGDLEKLDKNVVEYFWENLGGSVWEIWQCLLDYKNTGDYQEGVEKLIEDEYAKSLEFWKYKLDKKEQQIFDRVSIEIVKNGEYIIPREENIIDLVKKLVNIGIWFYNSVGQKITANSQTIKKAFEKMFL